MRAPGHDTSGGTICGAVAFVVLATSSACDKSGPTSPTPVCTYTLSAQGQQFSAEGGPGRVTISTDSQCAWAVENATGWVSLQSAATGTGPGSVNFTVSVNSDQAGRAKTLTVASVPFTIGQDGRTDVCTRSHPTRHRSMTRVGSGKPLSPLSQAAQVRGKPGAYTV